MIIEDFDYELPPDRIAQVPLPDREASRLMVVDRDTGRLDHRIFSALPSLVSPGDLVILNDTKVIPARLVGRRVAQGGSARVETLLVERYAGDGAGGDRRERGGQVWIALVRGRRRPGELIDYGGGLTGRVLDPHDMGGGVGTASEAPSSDPEDRARTPERVFDGAFHLIEISSDTGSVEEAMERSGRMPLPPYIRRPGPEAGGELDRRDRERYQTVVASAPGAVAAPTAGLHFTERLIGRLESMGVTVATLTLHVGPGTFRPVRTRNIEDHRMHAESFVIPVRLAESVARARAAGRRVIAVGSTVTRALEGSADADGRVVAGAGRCGLFIYPGFRFRVVDAIITNFHLPRSTLLMLVSAFAGRDRILAAYAQAVRSGYRFFSYGDAMIIGRHLPPSSE